MTLVLELSSALQGGTERHHKAASFPVFIGRGYDNDIIVNDPYVSARHLRIDAADGGWTITDLGSDNGTLIDGETVRNASRNITQGGQARIGHTELRFFTAASTVAPALIMETRDPLLSLLARPVAAVLTASAALVFILCWAYFYVWSDDIAATLAAAALGTAGSALTWALLWAVAGKLARGRTAFAGHVSLVSLYIIAGVVAWAAESYVSFLGGEGAGTTVFSHAVNAVMLAALIHASLALATWMPARKRRMIAGLFAIGLIAGTVALEKAGARRFSATPPYAATLAPHLSSLARAQDIDAFLAAGDRLLPDDKN